MEIGECGRGMRILNCIVVCVIGVKEKHIVPWYSAPKKKYWAKGLGLISAMQVVPISQETLIYGMFDWNDFIEGEKKKKVENRRENG